MPTPGGLVTKQELIDAQLDTAHLGRVSNSKDAGGNPINTSTNRTGGVNKTLDALQSEYQADIDNFVQVSDQVIVDKTAEYDQSIASKESEAEAAIDQYRLLNKGDYAAGITLENKFEFVVYNGESYFATNPPYTTTATLPDVDGNLFVGGYTTIENAAGVFSNANLLSNHNFLIPSPDSITHPSVTPTDYTAGTQIFSGVFVGSDIVGLTYVNGRVKWTNATGTLYFSVPKSGGLEYVTEFTASVADFDGNPRTRGVSFALVGDEYRVTVGVDALEDESANETPLGSVKFEQGSVATGHDSKSLFDIYGDPNSTRFINIKSFNPVGDGNADETDLLNQIIADYPNRLMLIPEGVTIKIDSVKVDFSSCSGLVGEGTVIIENETVGFTLVPDNFLMDGLSFDGETSFFDSFRIEGGAEGSDESTWSKGVTVRNCTFRNSHPEGLAQQYLCFSAARMHNTSFVNNRVTRGSPWFIQQYGVLIDGNNIDADRAGTQVRNTTAGADCIKLTGESWGVISNNILENAGRDGIDAFSAGNHLVISGNTIRNFYTEGIEVKSVDGGPISRYISITGNVIVDGGYDSSANHAAIWIDDNDTSDSIHDISIVGNTISKIGLNAGAGALYTGIRCTNAENAVISSNSITNIYSEDYTEYAINISGIDQGIVANNLITGDERGISASTIKDTIISGNKITTNRVTGSNTDIGLHFSGSQLNVRVEGNTVHSNGRALNAEGTVWDKVFVSNNTFLSNSGNIVWLGTLINCSFTGNYIESTVEANSVDGLYMSSQADEGTIIASNIVKNCRYGIYLRNSIGAIVTGNRGENISYTVYVVGGDYNIIKNNMAINANFDFQGPIGSNSIASDNLRVL